MKIFVLTPEKIIYEGETIKLNFYGIDGSFQLLDNHASMIAFLKEGNIHINKSIYHIKNGMLEVTNGMVKILHY